jgi:hypothetical protein
MPRKSKVKRVSKRNLESPTKKEAKTTSKRSSSIQTSRPWPTESMYNLNSAHSTSMDLTSASIGGIIPQRKSIQRPLLKKVHFSSPESPKLVASSVKEQLGHNTSFSKSSLQALRSSLNVSPRKSRPPAIDPAPHRSNLPAKASQGYAQSDEWVKIDQVAARRSSLERFLQTRRDASHASIGKSRQQKETDANKPENIMIPSTIVNPPASIQYPLTSLSPPPIKRTSSESPIAYYLRGVDEYGNEIWTPNTPSSTDVPQLKPEDIRVIRSPTIRFAGPLIHDTIDTPWPGEYVFDERGNPVKAGLPNLKTDLNIRHRSRNKDAKSEGLSRANQKSGMLTGKSSQDSNLPQKISLSYPSKDSYSTSSSTPSRIVVTQNFPSTTKHSASAPPASPSIRFERLTEEPVSNAKEGLAQRILSPLEKASPSGLGKPIDSYKNVPPQSAQPPPTESLKSTIVPASHQASKSTETPLSGKYSSADWVSASTSNSPTVRNPYSTRIYFPRSYTVNGIPKLKPVHKYIRGYTEQAYGLSSESAAPILASHTKTQSAKRGKRSLPISSTSSSTPSLVFLSPPPNYTQNHQSLVIDRAAPIPYQNLQDIILNQPSNMSATIEYKKGRAVNPVLKIASQRKPHDGKEKQTTGILQNVEPGERAQKRVTNLLGAKARRDKNSIKSSWSGDGSSSEADSGDDGIFEPAPLIRLAEGTNGDSGEILVGFDSQRKEIWEPIVGLKKYSGKFVQE